MSNENTKIKCQCGECNKENNSFDCGTCGKTFGYCYGQADAFFDDCDNCATAKMNIIESSKCEQLSKSTFKAEGEYFLGGLKEALEKFIRLNPSKKWFIWLQDNYPNTQTGSK